MANCLMRKLDDFRPPEQAGFRKGFSTVNHLHELRQVIQKTKEYNLPLCLAFVDYEKAFDSIATSGQFHDATKLQFFKSKPPILISAQKTGIAACFPIYNNGWAVLQSLQRRTDIEVLKSLYEHANTCVQMQDQISKPILLQRVVKQGDFILLNREGLCINELVTGEYIAHLRFPHDIVVMAQIMEDFSTMLDEISRSYKQVCLKTNVDKMKIMSSALVLPTPLEIGDYTLEVVKGLIGCIPEIDCPVGRW